MYSEKRLHAELKRAKKKSRGFGVSRLADKWRHQIYHVEERERSLIKWLGGSSVNATGEPPIEPPIEPLEWYVFKSGPVFCSLLRRSSRFDNGEHPLCFAL